MSETSAKPGWVLRVEPWITLIAGIATVAGILWSALWFFAPSKDVDLTIWERQEIPISLPTEARGLPISLTVGRDTVSRAILLDVLISNSGRTPLGSDKEPWELSLRVRDSARILLLPNVSRRPQNLQVQARFDTSSNRIALSIGLLNPKDEIGVRLLVIDPASVSGPRLSAQTRVFGLKEPLVTKYDLRERFEQGFFLPIWFPLFVVFLAVLWVELWKMRTSLTAGRILLRFFGTLFLAGYGAGLVAFGVAWLLARMAAMVINR